MDCRDAREHLSALIDEEAFSEADAVRGHLDRCVACARERAELEGCRRLVASLPRLAAPEGFAERVLRAIEQSEQIGASSPPTAATGASPAPARATPARPARPARPSASGIRPLSSFVAAAVALIATGLGILVLAGPRDRVGRVDTVAVARLPQLADEGAELEDEVTMTTAMAEPVAPPEPIGSGAFDEPSGAAPGVPASRPGRIASAERAHEREAGTSLAATLDRLPPDVADLLRGLADEAASKETQGRHSALLDELLGARARDAMDKGGASSDRRPESRAAGPGESNDDPELRAGPPKPTQRPRTSGTSAGEGAPPILDGGGAGDDGAGEGGGGGGGAPAPADGAPGERGARGRAPAGNHAEGLGRLEETGPANEEDERKRLRRAAEWGAAARDFARPVGRPSAVVTITVESDDVVETSSRILASSTDEARRDADRPESAPDLRKAAGKSVAAAGVHVVRVRVGRAEYLAVLERVAATGRFYRVDRFAPPATVFGLERTARPPAPPAPGGPVAGSESSPAPATQPGARPDRAGERRAATEEVVELLVIVRPGR